MLVEKQTKAQSNGVLRGVVVGGDKKKKRAGGEGSKKKTKHEAERSEEK